MIFLIILITFPFDDVVMLLGENRCWSLKGERGLIREVTLVEEGWLINQVGPPVPPDLYSTQEGHPSWFPLVRYIGDMSLTPGDFCQDSCPGGYPRYHSILSPPPPSVLSFLTPDWLFSCNTIFQKYFCCSRFSRFDCKRFPTTRILSISFLCVFCSLSGVEPLCQTTADWKSLLI